jgi:hypothetical protein
MVTTTKKVMMGNEEGQEDVVMKIKMMKVTVEEMKKCGLK